MRVIIAGWSRSGTTITRNIVNELSNTSISNECRTYNFLSTTNTFNDYVHFISKRALQRKTLSNIKPLLQLLNTNTSANKVDWIKSVEPILYKNCIRFGDKTGFSFTDDNLLDLVVAGLSCQIVYIYRDGRDVVASGKRLYKNKSIEKRRSWQNESITAMSDAWANNIFGWTSVRQHFPKGTTIEIRFEDYIHNPVSITKQIADHIKCSTKELKSSINNNFNTITSHHGYHKQLIPNWKDEFSPLAISALQTLGYIS
jgi:hypothetical protein